MKTKRKKIIIQSRYTIRVKLPHRINEETQIEEKFCAKCNKGEGLWHPLAKFNMKKASWDGLETKCEDCTKEKSKEYRTENPDYDKEYQSKNQDYLKAYKKEYYLRKSSKKKEKKPLE